MDALKEHVLNQVAQKGIRFIRLWFTDVSGTLKAVAIDPGELESAFNEGIGFDGSAIQGLTRVFESDMLLFPDPSTFAILPARSKDDEPVARLFCNVHTPDGQPAQSDPRGVLLRTLEKAKQLGFTVMVHPEVEFYLFKNAHDLNKLEPVDQAGYFDHVARGSSNDFRRKAVRALEEMGINVEFSHHEGGPGQNEIDLRATDALTSADNIMTLRTVVEEIALSENQVATFMPKPFKDHPGSGMHTHISLFEGDKNAFYDAGNQYELSVTGRRFMAGLLAHSREISAIFAQHVNSYKRLWGGGEAPSFICWGRSNRSALIRVPLHKPGKGKSTRIEFRAIDSAANPYLALAVIIAAGLAGIEGKYDLPEEAEDDMWRLSDLERKALGVAQLPHSLSEAVSALSESDLVAQTLGEETFDFVIREKLQEWHEYREQVTTWELERFLRGR
ncbi:glutamine synthetase, beta-grasp domain protein [Gleimia coleocanis DSM 15436]|uniref:Glutamine synthetase, beta-grasp domain protein n=1 Tax=Gleimia coleocanis DSM 15436 TaxID=525245 RepID=C0W0H0_9ACTO|nr:glutamine synthetase family protein [Gleimia coleocanis]EEH64029.1 glutamine synthetase, beta-grasp domain protein [Gleimia coleocanis DSM 15436]